MNIDIRPIGKCCVHVVQDEAGGLSELCMLVERLGFEPWAHASHDEFLQILPDLAPALILLDFGKTDQKVLQALCVPRSPHQVIVSIAQGDVCAAVTAMQAGAVDCVEKPLMPERLPFALDHAFDLLDCAIIQHDHHARAAAALKNLSARECELLRSVTNGETNKEIARDLKISVRTVEMFRSSMMRKLNARNVAELVKAAIDSGFLPH
jgi:two-component system response regulator FixJ